MNLSNIFAQNLKHYRNKLGFSQEKFAEECGLHRTYISDLECSRRNVSLMNIQKIAQALNIQPYKLLMEYQDEKK